MALPMVEVRGPIVETTIIRAGQPCPHPYVNPDGELGLPPGAFCQVCFNTGRTPVNLKMRRHARPKGGKLLPVNRISWSFPDGRGPGATWEDLPTSQRSMDWKVAPPSGLRPWERRAAPRAVA